MRESSRILKAARACERATERCKWLLCRWPVVLAGLVGIVFANDLPINPAIAHGIDFEVGSLEPGKLADIVLWKPAFFGAKPAMIIKGGMIIAAPMGDPNASIPTPQPVHYRHMFGAYGGALAETSVSFISEAARSAGLREKLGLKKRTPAVRDIRSKKKSHMIHNDALPKIEVDSQTYEVRADGVLLTCEPASVLPLAQKYFLF